jgi:hypothetical protein
VNAFDPLMRPHLLFRIFILAAFPSILFSCTRKIEEFQSEPLSDYIPLQTGKYITYRIDSTVFPNFGTSIATHSYLVKHVIDEEITDNLGRPSFRVYRFISNKDEITGTPDLHANGSYFITPVGNRIEVIEDNLRFLKLHLPVKKGFTWKGNKYLSYDPYGDLYTFSNDDFMADWDFYYDKFEESVSYDGHNYSNVYSVEEANESFNVPIVSPNNYAFINRAVSKYAKNIGLVYREYTLWEYQPNPGGSPYRIGFGLRMWMVDHN